MTDERKAYYKTRITESSMTEIIVVMYEIMFDYLEEATDGEFVNRESARNAARVLGHLMDSLDFRYEISANLYALYDFCSREISKSIYKNDSEHFAVVKRIMKSLYESFVEVAKQDTSGAAMSNSQKVKAGITYGRSDVNEILEGDSNRGFLV